MLCWFVLNYKPIGPGLVRDIAHLSLSSSLWLPILVAAYTSTSIIPAALRLYHLMALLLRCFCRPLSTKWLWHFDTAKLYGASEVALGEAIRDALSLGYITSRDQLFITSKLWASDAYRDQVVPALRMTLENLGLDWLDLYLIHWPASAKPGTLLFPFKKGETYPMDFQSVWEGMEECQNLGLTKSIGVSNFSTKKLDIILATSKIPPAVNQVEINPCWQQKKLLEYCKQKGIHITAYSPLGANGTVWGTNKVMNCELLKEIARAKQKSHAQVCLRWVYEQGVSVIVKSFNKERMKENLDILDWELTPEERNKIGQIPQHKGCLALDLVTEGPYASLKDLWEDDYE